MTPLGRRTNRWLTWFHRWAGVVLALLFIAWFASAAVLHFVPFPALPDANRWEDSERIDVSRLTVEPAVALANAPDATGLRLVSVNGEPTYIASFADRPMAAISDGRGQPPRTLSASGAREIAERFARVAATRVDGPLEYDQWTVHQRFDPYRPFFVVRLDDPAGTDLYVSRNTGEVVQRTKQAERTWNWFGAVLHWLYFTPLRHSWNVWNQVVWWISLVALSSALVGTWLGYYRLVKNKSAGRKGLTPFRGWMGWHHRIGLFASVVVLFWLFSGWLSMDHGRFFSRGVATSEQNANMQGLTLARLTENASLDAIRALGPGSSLRFGAVAGHAVITAWGTPDHAARVALLEPSGSTVVARAIPEGVLRAGLQVAWPGDGAIIRESTTRDDTYNLAESVSDSAIRYRIPGPEQLRVYVEPESGRILSVMNASRRAYAWVYYALHTLKFPGLASHPVVRSTVVLLLLAVGLAFCVTGTIVGYITLRRNVVRR